MDIPIIKNGLFMCSLNADLMKSYREKVELDRSTRTPAMDRDRIETQWEWPEGSAPSDP